MRDAVLDRLHCPRDHDTLTRTADSLGCAAGHRYPIHEGVPVMLLDDVPSTHDSITTTLQRVASDDHPAGSTTIAATVTDPGAVDPFVQAEIPYTSGQLYFSAQHRLHRYPIPELRLPRGSGEFLLDIGCNWGRWSVAAGRLGYRPIGLDPSLDAVLAAQRVCVQLGIEADFVVGDARHLPFADHSFDVVFSYSVFQHFSKPDAERSIGEAARVLHHDGTALVQMPNRRGIRQYQQHRRRGFSEGTGFDVRYWKPDELLAKFDELIGPTDLSADCYFGLGIQGRDVDLLRRRHRVVVRASELLRHASTIVPPLRNVADSVYLRSVKPPRQAR